MLDGGSFVGTAPSYGGWSAPIPSYGGWSEFDIAQHDLKIAEQSLHVQEYVDLCVHKFLR